MCRPVDRLGRFVILLAKTGRDQEALTVYLYMVSFTEQGGPMVLGLPSKQEYDERRWEYSPALIRAMADVAIASDSDGLERLMAAERHALLKEALKLEPYSATAWFYYAEELRWDVGPIREITDAYKKAAQYDHGEHHGLIEKRAEARGVLLK